MKTRAAVLHKVDGPFVVEELELGAPKFGEVQVRMAYAGLCHTDVHLQVGDMPVSYPYLAGHEGSGVVESIGEGVTRVSEGDHVVFSFIPACGYCRWCSTGHQNLCDRGATIIAGTQQDGTFRLHRPDGTPVPQFCGLGTFSQRAVVPEASCVAVPSEIPLDAAALVGCGVTTGYGSSVYAAGVRPGDTVVIYGLGGIGIAAIQGAALSGAAQVVAVDPLEWKGRAALEFGASHAALDHQSAFEITKAITDGVMADHAIICAGLVEPSLIGQALQMIRKGGQVTLTGVVSAKFQELPINAFELLLFEKSIKGNLYGGANPHSDIKQIINMYAAGRIKLDEMITKRYTLDEINQGYEDLVKGSNIRGVIDFMHER